MLRSQSYKNSERRRKNIQKEQQVQRSWGENELALFFLDQKAGSWSTVGRE